MSADSREALAAEVFDASLRSLKKRLDSGEATAADHAVALNVARYLRIGALPSAGSSAGDFLRAAEEHLPFPGGDGTH